MVSGMPPTNDARPKRIVSVAAVDHLDEPRLKPSRLEVVGQGRRHTRLLIRHARVARYPDQLCKKVDQRRLLDIVE
jgi:hypothetical protein